MLPYSSLIIIGHACVVAAIGAKEDVDVILFHEMNVPNEYGIDQRNSRTPSSSVPRHLLLQLLEEEQESARAVLQLMRSAGDLADTDLARLGRFPLRHTRSQDLNELPALSNGLQLLRREDIVQQHRALLGRIYGGEEFVEIFEGFGGGGHEEKV